jgi:hypothetical protein
LNQANELPIICHIIRAKVYEMFNYRFRFVSDDYSDIWGFISRHYDVLSYHDCQKEWFNNETDKLQQKVMRIKNAIKINQALFWESDAKKAPSRRKRKET